MPNYNTLTIHTVFETIWDAWKNKDGEHAALKAVTFFLKENTKEELLKACEAYTLENAGADPEFTYKLSNFLNMGHWQDVLEANNLDKLRAKKNAAIEVIEEWNKACQSHWIKVIDIEARIPLAQKALNDKFFSTNWRDALQKAKKIFAYKFREGDSREKININFPWFVRVSSDKHTTLRLVEGEFGKGSPERIVETYQKKEIDYAARQKLAEDMKEMFPSIKFEPVKSDPPSKQEKIAVSKEAVEIVEKMKSELGKKPIKQFTKDVSKITERVVDEITKGNTEEGSEHDPYEFS